MSNLLPGEVQKKLGKIKKPIVSQYSPNTLSICMIVKDEEANIEAAVRSFIPFADEIIVNDTGSKDKTLEILSRLPVKVIQSEWKQDFSYSRNLSIDEAKSSWVLWMDADDRVEPSQVETFKKLKTAPLDRCFAFQVVNTQAGLAVGTRFMQTRMFPNHPKLRFERPVHEQIIFACAEMGLHSFAIETEILHTGYENVELKKSKAQRNIDLLIDNPDRDIDPILGMQEGDSYAILEQWEKSIDSYKHAYEIENLKEIHRDVFNEIPNCIGRGYLALGDQISARKWFEEGLKNEPNKIEPYYYIGESFFKDSDFKSSKKWFDKALNQKRTFSSVANQFDVMRMYSFNFACRIEVENKNWASVIDYASKFLEEYEQIVESRVYLAKAYLALKQHAEAYLYFSEAIKMNPKATVDIWDAFFWLLNEMKKSDSEIESWTKIKNDSLGIKAPVEKAVKVAEKKSLSVCMIVKNESENLRRCLDSFKDLDCELNIVDTGSSDDTVAIAKDFTDRVFHFDWVDNFSKARNHSFDQATGDWILWLDADDVIPQSEIAKIQKLAQTKTKNKAYGFSVINTINEGVTGAAFNQIRLVPNSKGIRFVGKVHEQLMPSLQKKNIKVEFLSTVIHHTGYLNDEINAQKQNRNLKIMIDEMDDDPTSVTAIKIYSVAGCYQDLKEYSLAKTWYVKALNRAETIGEDPHVIELAPLKIAECLAEEGDYENALKKVEKGIELYPLNPEMMRLKAQILEASQNIKGAFEAYLRLLFYKERQFLFPVDFPKLRFKSIRFMAHYFSETKKELAVEILRLGKKMQEGELLSTQKILSLMYDHEVFLEAKVLLLISLEQDPQPEGYLNLAKLSIILDEAKEAIELLEEGRKFFPSFSELAELKALLYKDLGLTV